MSRKLNRRQDLENGSVLRATHSKITVEKNGLTLIRIYFLISAIILYGFHSQNQGIDYVSEIIWLNYNSLFTIV